MGPFGSGPLLTIGGGELDEDTITAQSDDEGLLAHAAALRLSRHRALEYTHVLICRRERQCQRPPKGGALLMLLGHSRLSGTRPGSAQSWLTGAGLEELARTVQLPLMGLAGRTHTCSES